ncbi:MAG: hypothetical protein E6973_07735 [Enterobacter hormaechei]|nr:hypothetical protein [Enterobacter hormaechei]
MAVGKLHGGRDPFPAFPGDRLGLARELFSCETIEQGDVPQPTAIIMLKEVTLDRTARLLVGINANEAGTPIRGSDSIFGEHSADLIGLVVTGTAHVVPDLLLSGVVRSHGKCHELFEGHSVFGIDLVQLRRH